MINLTAEGEGCFDVKDVMNPEDLTVTDPFQLWTSDEDLPYKSTPKDISLNFGNIGFAPKVENSKYNAKISWDKSNPNNYNIAS